MKKKPKYLIIACFLSIFVLLIGYFILGAAISLKENTMLLTKIQGMKMIGVGLKSYEEKNGSFPDCKSVDELIRVLEINSKELKRYLPDLSDVTYDSNDSDENGAILVWKSDIRTSISPESFLKKYHYEATYRKKNGVFCSRHWEQTSSSP